MLNQKNIKRLTILNTHFDVFYSVYVYLRKRV